MFDLRSPDAVRQFMLLRDGSAPEAEIRAVCTEAIAAPELKLRGHALNVLATHGLSVPVDQLLGMLDGKLINEHGPITSLLVAALDEALVVRLVDLAATMKEAHWKRTKSLVGIVLGKTPPALVPVLATASATAIAAARPAQRAAIAHRLGHALLVRLLTAPGGAEVAAFAKVVAPLHPALALELEQKCGTPVDHDALVARIASAAYHELREILRILLASCSAATFFERVSPFFTNGELASAIAGHLADLTPVADARWGDLALSCAASEDAPRADAGLVLGRALASRGLIEPQVLSRAAISVLQARRPVNPQYNTAWTALAILGDHSLDEANAVVVEQLAHSDESCVRLARELVTAAPDRYRAAFGARFAAGGTMLSDGDVKDLRLALGDEGVRVDGEAFASAVRCRDVALVERGLREGCDPNETRWSQVPLLVAVLAYSNDEEFDDVLRIVEVLVAAGADPRAATTFRMRDDDCWIDYPRGTTAGGILRGQIHASRSDEQNEQARKLLAALGETEAPPEKKRKARAPSARDLSSAG